MDIVAALATRPLPAGYIRRRLLLPPKSIHPYRIEEWDDTLVAVHAGAIVLIGRSSETYLFPSGALLCLAQVPLRALRAAGSDACELITIRRTPR